MRRCILQMGKVFGTEWPDGWASGSDRPSGEQAPSIDPSLGGIFRRAGIELLPSAMADDHPGHPRGFPFDLGELHSLMTQLRGRAGAELRAPESEPKPWAATALLVPAIAYASGRTIRRPLGVMFDCGAADLDGVPREGCAVAWNRVGADPLIGLHTLAHELGHVFNLRHPHEESPPEHHGRTLMFETRVLARSRAFPADIEFDFSAAGKAWLTDGPDDFVRPGGRPYGARPGLAEPAVAPPTDDSLRLEAAPFRTLPWQPVELVLRRSPGDPRRWPPFDLDPAGGMVTIEMSVDGESWLPAPSPVRECGTVVQGGGQRPSATILLPGLCLAAPGKLHLRARVAPAPSQGIAAAVSPPLHVEIAAPCDSAERAVSAFHSDFAARLAVCFRSLGLPTGTTAAGLEALSRDVDLTAHAPRLAFTLARHRLRTGSSADRLRARHDLAALRTSLPAGPLRAEVIATLAGYGAPRPAAPPQSDGPSRQSAACHPNAPSPHKLAHSRMNHG